MIESFEDILVTSRDGLITGEYHRDNSITINKGSFFRTYEVQSLLPHIKNLRKYLIDYGFVKNGILTKPYIFESPSLAICTLLGHMESGLSSFYTVDNILLSDFLSSINDLNNNMPRAKVNHDDLPGLVSSSQLNVSNKLEPLYSPESCKQQISVNIIQYARDSIRAKNVLSRSNFQCAIDENHITFISKNGLPYMEAHHLIPLAFQDKFKVSLDVDANIVCLCPNCHRQLHYGKNIDGLLEKLYTMQKDKLIKSGINITLEELKSLYTK